MHQLSKRESVEDNSEDDMGDLEHEPIVKVPLTQNAIFTPWKVLTCPSIVVKKFFDFIQKKKF